MTPYTGARAFLVSLLVSTGAMAMEPLDNDHMAEVSARDGISLELVFRANMEPDGSGGHQPIAAAPFNSCEGADNACRLGLEFAECEGQWLMLKDYFAEIRINDLLLDAAVTETGGTGSGFQGDMSQFQAPDSSCLLTGAGSGCEPGDADGLPALQMSFPASAPLTDYDDLLVLQNIGRVAAEYDGGGVAGYDRDAASGSVLGFRTGDAFGGAARARIEGRALVYGF